MNGNPLPTAPLSPAVTLLQRDLALGQYLTCWLESGERVAGRAVELGLDHLVIDRPDRRLTVLLDAVVAYLVGESPAARRDKEKASAGPSTLSPVPSPVRPDAGPDGYSRLLREIEQRIESRASRAKIEPRPVSFELDLRTLAGPQAAVAAKGWQQARSMYEYAVRMNETHPRFGRMSEIGRVLLTVHRLYPHIPEITRHLAFIYWCLDGQDRGEALELYRNLARGSYSAAAYLDRAAAALSLGKIGETCTSLEEFFLVLGDRAKKTAAGADPIGNNLTVDSSTGNGLTGDRLLDAWYTYLVCAGQLPAYRPSIGFCHVPARLPSQYRREWVEGAIYLLATHAEVAAATELLSRWYPSGDSRSTPPEEAVSQVWEVVARRLGKISGPGPVLPVPPDPPISSDPIPTDCIDPREWLHARNCHVCGYLVVDHKETLRNELARLLGDHYAYVRTLYWKIREVVSTGGKIELNATDWEKESVKLSRELCRHLLKLHYLSDYNYDKTRSRFHLSVAPNPNGTGNFLLGGWFERYVYLKLNEMLKDNGWVGTCLCNVKIILPVASQCELDVFGMVNGKPVWIECKTNGLSGDLGKYTDIRPYLGVDKELAFAVELDLPEERCSLLTAAFGVTVVNQNQLFAKLQGALTSL